MNILYVCTGNTCRSPMAEGITRALADKEGLPIVTLSAGLFAANGAPVTPFAVEAVKDIVDISEHRSRPLSVPIMEAADIVVGMTEGHKAILLRQFPDAKDRITTLAEWAGETGDVPDPFGESQEVYTTCAARLKELIEKGLVKHKAEIES